MGKRTKEQVPLWVATSDLPVSPGHPFYRQLNAALDAHGFDAFVEAQCAPFYGPVMGRPGLLPGRYFVNCWISRNRTQGDLAEYLDTVRKFH